MTSLGFSFRNPVRRQFLRGLLGKIFLQTVFVLALIEGVFLAEKFSEIFNMGANKHARAGEILLLLLCASPEILDLALALAVLVAVYRVLLRAREDRELLVMAGAGMETKQLVGILLGLAIFAQAGSLLISGVVGPAAQYAQRVVLFNAEFRALRNGASAGQFYFFPQHVVYVGAETKSAPERRLFIRESLAGTDRVITANRAALEGPDAKGRLALHLRDFLAYDFDRDDAGAGAGGQTLCPGCPALPGSAPAVTMRIRNFTQQFSIEQLLAFDPRGTDVGEWTLPELLGLSPPPAPLHVVPATSLGERIGRSLLCLLAPFLACAALAFTARATQLFAMPAACVALLALDLAATLLVGALAPFGKVAILVALGGGALGVLLLLAFLMVRAQNALLRPALARP